MKNRQVYMNVRQPVETTEQMKRSFTMIMIMIMRLRTVAKFFACLIAVFAGTAFVVHAQESAGGPIRDFLYVAVPGSSEVKHGATGMGILVFDVRDNFRFVKRIPTWAPPSTPTGYFQVKGITASPENGALYISSSEGLMAIDLASEKVLWQQNYEGNCCDRGQVSPDGKILYMPAWGAKMEQRSREFVIDARTGNLITAIPTPDNIPTQNEVWAPDGSRVYMAGSTLLAVFDPKTHKLERQIGPFSGRIKPFTINAAGTLIYATIDDDGNPALTNGKLFGFEIADTKTGKIVHRVEVSGFPMGSKETWGPHLQVSHGIAITPDEKEVWLPDSTNQYLHVFDNTVMPPKQKAGLEVKVSGKPYWITVGLDGKYIFSSTGDVIDRAAKKVVHVLKDEFGLQVRSEKMMELEFSNGKLVRMANQVSMGQVSLTTKSKSKE